jgi:Zn/Cd-binding protein ZinT
MRFFIFFIFVAIISCTNSSQKGKTEIILTDTTQEKTDSLSQKTTNLNTQIDTIENRELDPWEEYTMNRADSIIYKQISGYYFVPHAAGTNMQFNTENGTCTFHDVDEKLQLCIYQVQKNKLHLFGNKGVEFIFDIKPAIPQNTGFRFIQGEYVFVRADD